MATLQYLFGTPVGVVAPSARDRRRVFVLGAYPSALHVAWRAPDGSTSIQAIAVADEPQSFWDGSDQAERIELWKKNLGFHEQWGQVAPCGQYNGPSGRWVDKHVLGPLGVDRNAAWLTDCLNVYHESTGAAERLADAKLAGLLDRLGIPRALHRTHPSEDAIVRGALEHQRPRLLSELAAAEPETIVTLGNAALRVMGGLCQGAPAGFCRLDCGDDYGARIPISVGSLKSTWIPLAHPAAPQRYQERHARWEADLRTT